MSSDPPKMPARVPPLTVTPIGVVHSPFRTRVEAPRQPRAGAAAEGRVELWPGCHFEDALSDVDAWEYLWLVFQFHRNEGWRPKVRPPRSDRKQGVFATRAPYRPNPIGLSAVRLLRVEGLTLHVAELDLLDGTPVLDIKPYVAWADSIPEAGEGWLPEARRASLRPGDPGPRFVVDYAPLARAQLDYLRDAHALDLTGQIETVLSTGPRPHAYRRIRALPDGRALLGVKDWRALFRVDGDRVEVLALRSGHAPDDPRRPLPAAHAAFVARFSDRDA